MGFFNKKKRTTSESQKNQTKAPTPLPRSLSSHATVGRQNSNKSVRFATSPGKILGVLRQPND